MSFCKLEGDEKAINSILNKIKNDNKTFHNVDTYMYSGNIKEALNVLSNAQIIVGTRFHANILGLIMNKTVIPIAYSNKTINAFKDMKFKGRIFDMQNKENFNIEDLTEKDLTYKLNITNQVKDAERQFEKLDLVLDRRKY